MPRGILGKYTFLEKKFVAFCTVARTTQILYIALQHEALAVASPPAHPCNRNTADSPSTLRYSRLFSVVYALLHRTSNLVLTIAIACTVDSYVRTKGSCCVALRQQCWPGLSYQPTSNIDQQRYECTRGVCIYM